MTAPGGADVVVVGGGAVGLSAAWRLAGGGADVLVVDPEPGRGASYAAAGMLAPVTEVHYGEEPLTRLALESARRWPSFARELEAASGASVGYERGGTLLVALDADDDVAVGELVRYQLELGLAVRRLRGRECRALEPALSPAVRGGAAADGDDRVDPRALLDALLAACSAAGVRLHRERVAEVLVRGGRAAGVRLASGTDVPAGTVVAAAGCWSGGLGGLPPAARIPVRPVKGQIVTLRGPVGAAVLGRAVRGLVHGSSVYLVPRADGRVVVGATMEERGWDTRVTAGGVYELLRDAVALVPGVDDLELVEVRAGSRPGSPDNAPMIGWGALERLAVATGHHRNGILLAPVTADAVAELVRTGDVPPVAAPFAPGRFAVAGVPA